MNGTGNQRKSFWEGLSKLDWAALVVCAFGLWAGLAGISSQGAAWMGPARLLGIAAAFYLLYRFWTSWRSELLWSLRNRLMVAYLFIWVRTDSADSNSGEYRGADPVFAACGIPALSRY